MVILVPENILILFINNFRLLFLVIFQEIITCTFLETTTPSITELESFKNSNYKITCNPWSLKRELKNGNEIFMCKNKLDAVIRRIWINIPTEYVQNDMW